MAATLSVVVLTLYLAAMVSSFGALMSVQMIFFIGVALEQTKPLISASPMLPEPIKQIFLFCNIVFSNLFLSVNPA